MKGTEKQIAWAQDIVEKIEQVLDNALELAKNRNFSQIDALAAVHTKILNNIKTQDVGTIINDFKNIELTSDAEGDYARLQNCLLFAARDGRNYNA